MKDTEVYGSTKLSDLLEEIHDTTTKKRNDIKEIIQQLVEMMKDSNDAVMLLPLIKDLYKVSVENDDQIVKVATIVQRLISADSYAKGNNEGNDFLSDAERDQLIENATSELKQNVSRIDLTLASLKDNSNIK